MQTTLRIRDDLYRQAKVEAAREGVTLTRFLESALQMRLTSQQGGVQKNQKTNGLEKFAACMPFASADEEKQWDEAMKVFDVIDENVWK
jgi:hypothetical protein